MTTMQLSPEKTERKVGETLDHLYCCDEDLSLCGLDISGHEEVDYMEDLCIVCWGLEYSICERCGE